MSDVVCTMLRDCLVVRIPRSHCACAGEAGVQFPVTESLFPFMETRFALLHPLDLTTTRR